MEQTEKVSMSRFLRFGSCIIRRSAVVKVERHPNLSKSLLITVAKPFENIQVDSTIKPRQNDSVDEILVTFDSDSSRAEALLHLEPLGRENTLVIDKVVGAWYKSDEPESQTYLGAAAKGILYALLACFVCLCSIIHFLRYHTTHDH